MFIRVDKIEGQDKVEGYSYRNTDGGFDLVEVDGDVVCLSDDSGCFDIRTYFDVPEWRQDYYEDKVANGDTIVYNTGLKFEIPENHAMLVYSRSGHGFNNSVRLSNCVEVIDSDCNRGLGKNKGTAGHTLSFGVTCHTLTHCI